MRASGFQSQGYSLWKKEGGQALVGFLELVRIREEPGPTRECISRVERQVSFTAGYCGLIEELFLLNRFVKSGEHLDVMSVPASGGKSFLQISC
jgi:hypothetical protein